MDLAHVAQNDDANEASLEGEYKRGRRINAYPMSDVTPNDSSFLFIPNCYYPCLWKHFSLLHAYTIVTIALFPIMTASS